MSDVNVYGGSGETARDSFCTPLEVAELIGPVDVDPCSNARSHIRAALRFDGITACGLGMASRVLPTARVFMNPPYSRGCVARWVQHYLHTDFQFLLRWDPSTAWFRRVCTRARFAWFYRDRIEFEPPPGVETSSNPFPHAIFSVNEPNAAMQAAGTTWRLHP